MDAFEDISWNVKITDSNGIILFKQPTSGLIEKIDAHDSIIIQSFLFGFVSIKIRGELDWGNYETSAFLLGPFCFLNR